MKEEYLWIIGTLIVGIPALIFAYKTVKELEED